MTRGDVAPIDLGGWWVGVRSDTKATDTKATDTKPTDTKATDTKATDTKATDTKVARRRSAARRTDRHGPFLLEPERDDRDATRVAARQLSEATEREQKVLAEPSRRGARIAPSRSSREKDSDGEGRRARRANETASASTHREDGRKVVTKRRA